MEAAKKIFTRAHIIWFLLLNFGLVLLAAGIHFFKSPNNFAMGGTSGISIIAATLLPHMDVGTFMFIINGVLIVLGLVFLGRAVIGATLYSSVALSFYVWVLERAVPMARPFTDDTFLELCYAVILPAAGSAIIFNIGASSGGTDIIAMILSKYTSLEIGKALLVSDFCIALFAGGLYGVRTGLYCVLGLLAKAFVVDGVIEGINVATCHVKPKKQGEEGGIIRREIPMYASKVMRVCPKCGKATREAFKVENGAKVRVCKKCGETI